MKVYVAVVAESDPKTWSYNEADDHFFLFTGETMADAEVMMYKQFEDLFGYFTYEFWYKDASACPEVEPYLKEMGEKAWVEVDRETFDKVVVFASEFPQAKEEGANVS